MLLYLLNASLIWLLSLLFFDLVLKRETFHSANRIYLNATWLLGLLLPLVSFSDQPADTAAITDSVKNIYILKSSVVEAAIPESPGIVWSLERVLWGLYFAGLFAAMLIVYKEIIQIIRLYRQGRKTRYAHYLLIETRQPHSPFSFGKNIFIHSKEKYSAAQLNMVLEHERKHVSRLHTIDKLFFTLVKIAFWFHPLVYLYYSRLMMAQEYEADNTMRKEVQQYGTFLIEQSLIRSHTLVTHSFNHSPIKNRIIMLTKNKSSQVKLLKYAFMLPMLLVFLVCCSKEMRSLHQHERKQTDNKITFKGNEFELSKEVVDSLPVEDPATGEISILKITRTSYPIKMNGNRIYGWQDNGEAEASTLPILKTDEGNVALYIYQQLKTDFDKLEDGEYEVHFYHLIVDEKGNLAYYDQPELINLQNAIAYIVNDKGILNEQEIERRKKTSPTKPNPELKSRIEDKLTEVMDGDMQFIPAQAGGKNVISLLQSTLKFSVKNHRAQFVNS